MPIRLMTADNKYVVTQDGTYFAFSADGDAIWVMPKFYRSDFDMFYNTPDAFLNVLDLNRIEANTKYLIDKLKTLGYYSTASINIEFPWTQQKYFKLDHLNKIKMSIQKMRETFTTYPGMGDLFVHLKNTSIPHTELNYIEYCQYDLKWFVDSIQETYNYSGMTYSEGG